MVNCLKCDKETSNPRFCSLSCSSSYNSRAKYCRIGFCLRCGKVFDKTDDSRKVYCSRSCSATVNSHLYPKRKRKYSTQFCLMCNAPFNRDSKYCSDLCKRTHDTNLWIERWLAGLEDGISGSGTNKRIKDYLIFTRGNKCERCSWAEVNPYTNKVPIQLEHKDGNWQNNAIENLELLCPNCHSLTPTYCGANVGHGRPSRELWRKKIMLQ